MAEVIKNVIKNLALSVMPNSNRLRYLFYRPVLEQWKVNSGQYPFFANRFEMYNFINREILGNNAIEYLEFGVFQGESIRYFSELNSHPDSTFCGFDTFEGLPEDWVEFSRTVTRKTFSTNGGMPEIDDQRVSFIKGLFQESLPGFLNNFESGNQLVIHNDSDLYSATLFVLTLMNDYLTRGTVIIFDEFYSVLDEFRALEDYSSAYMRTYEVIAATDKHTQVAIRLR